MSADRFDLTIYRAIKALVYFQGGSVELSKEQLNGTDELRLGIELSQDGKKTLLHVMKRDTQGGQDESGTG